MKKTKYIYYKIIQEYWSCWEDADFHEADSSFSAKDYPAFKENLKAYRENSGCAIRVIERRELRTAM